MFMVFFPGVELLGLASLESGRPLLREAAFSRQPVAMLLTLENKSTTRRNATH